MELLFLTDRELNQADMETTPWPSLAAVYGELGNVFLSQLGANAVLSENITQGRALVY